MSEQRTTYRGTAYVRRTSPAGTTLTPKHGHRWQPYPADPRFEYCLGAGCPARRMADWTQTPLSPAAAVPVAPAAAPCDGPIQPGDIVRIHAQSEAAYAPVHRGKRGRAVSVTVSRTTKVRRWLVDYDRFGRYQVREEHLVVVGRPQQQEGSPAGSEAAG